MHIDTFTEDESRD